MSKSIDSIGKVYGQLTILSIDGINKKGHCRNVTAKCECGTIKQFNLRSIKAGHTKSCGCFKKQFVTKKNTTHGLRFHPLYPIWLGMKKRCYNTHTKDYKGYGAKGIFICDEWLHNFKSFHDWAILNGWKKELSIDRYPNKIGPYAPDNCRFATVKEQNRNTRRNRLITYNQQTKCLSEWSEILNIPLHTLKRRLNRNKWSVEKSFAQ